MKSHYITKPFPIMAILVILLVSSCNSNSETISLSPTPPNEPIEITIGYIGDMTGRPAAGYWSDHMVRDVIEYYTHENIIDGIKFELVSYDCQYDFARIVPGYEKLLESGADLFYSDIPDAAAVLQPFLERDKNVLFNYTSSEDYIYPPSYVFMFGTFPKYEIMTLLKWIAQNDWEWQMKGPAKIGGVIWNDSYGESLAEGLQTYCSEHPEQYDLVDIFSLIALMNLDVQVEALKDCDYVIPLHSVSEFAAKFKEAGHSTTFIGTNAFIDFPSKANAIFHDNLDENNLWEEIDRMLLVKPYLWANENGEFYKLVNDIIQSSGCEEEIIHIPYYLSVIYDLSLMFGVIEHTIDTYGYDSFNSDKLYESLQSFSYEIDGCPHSFSQTKRTSSDALGVFEILRINENEQSLLRADPDWIPIVNEP